MTISAALRKLTDAVRVRHFSRGTEKAYGKWLLSYMEAVRKYPVEMTSEGKVSRFLTEEARRGVAASTQNQALSALVFFYGSVLKTPLADLDAMRVTRPATVRVALSVEQTAALLRALEDVGGYPTRMVARLIYGCGLRVTEPLELRVKDVDVAARRLVVRGAKGGKDRVVALPEALAGEMEGQLRVARAVWSGDTAAGVPVAVPGLLARKSPRAVQAVGWAWVFPGLAPGPHPRTGERVRWRMHEVNVQRGVRAAAARAGIEGKVTPHVLRHCYATHAHRAGAAVRDLQEVMGHTQVETTMRYLSPEGEKVPSPLDALAVS